MNYTVIEATITTLSIGALFGNILIIATICAYLLKKFTPLASRQLKKYFSFLKSHNILFALFVSIISVSGSLFFSEYADFAPCKLCWFQRIFMYPLVIILGMSFFKNKKEIADSALPLSILGLAIAIYHYALQMINTFGNVPEILTPCSVVGMTPACTSYFFVKFGYITIPMLSVSAFSLIVLFMLIEKTKAKKS